MKLIPTFAAPKYFLIAAKGRLKKGWNESENTFGANNYHDLISLFLAFLDFEKAIMSATLFVCYGNTLC